MKNFSGNLKYKKPFRFKLKKGNRIERFYFKPFFGIIGIQSEVSGFLTFKEIEAGRIVLRRYLRLYDKLNIRKFLFDYKYKLKVNIFFYYPVTKKSVGIRMGKGKGNISFWNCVIKKGLILYEIRCLYLDNFLIECLNKCRERLSIKTRIIKLIY